MTRADTVRQAATVAGAVGQVVLPALVLPRLLRDRPVPDVAQPVPWAFGIWLPVYATTLAYAGWQARPAQRELPVLRAVGGPFAASLVSTAAWAPLLRGRRYWAAQVALSVTAGGAELARTRLAARTGPEVGRLAVPFGLQAGWGTAAAAVNLASMLVDSGPPALRRAPTATGAGVVLAAGALAAARVRATPPGRSAVYAGSLLWGLFGIAVGQARARPAVTAAAVAAAVPVAAALRLPRR